LWSGDWYVNEKKIKKENKKIKWREIKKKRKKKK
jgi:hypothetical protein